MNTSWVASAAAAILVPLVVRIAGKVFPRKESEEILPPVDQGTVNAAVYIQTVLFFWQGRWLAILITYLRCGWRS